MGELERGWLERSFEKDEILSVVRDMEGGEAPEIGRASCRERVSPYV